MGAGPPGRLHLSGRPAPTEDAFRAWTGTNPDGVWAAPGRVNLIGEHTDYNDGFALPVSIDRQVVAAVRRRDDGTLRCRSIETGEAEVRLDDVRPGAPGGWFAYVAGVAWSLRLAGVPVDGADILLTSDVPPGAGLASSAAVEVATALALAELNGSPLDRVELARVAHRAETEVVGVPAGMLDQVTALFGSAGSALLLDCRTLLTEPVPVDLDAAGLCLLVVDTGVRHEHATGGYGQRRAECAAAAAVLGVAALRDARADEVEVAADRLGTLLHGRARHVVTENARVLAAAGRLRAEGPAALGDLLAQSHASLRDDFEVSCAELDLAVEAACRAGAVGARMTGGGFGGSVLALVPLDRTGAVEEAVLAAFSARGLAAPHVLDVHIGPGARRLA